MDFGQKKTQTFIGKTISVGIETTENATMKTKSVLRKKIQILVKTFNCETSLE